MTDSLDMLPEPVREAVERQDRAETCDEYCPVCADRKTIRAEADVAAHLAAFKELSEKYRASEAELAKLHLEHGHE